MKNTIKVGFDPQTNLYTFKTPGDHSIKNLDVNGKNLVDPLLGYKAGTLMITSEKPETITYNYSNRKHIGYDNIEDNTTLSIKEYNDTVKSFNRALDVWADEYVYADIETEVKATRFMRNMKHIYETIETVHNLEIEMVEYPVSEYTEIVPLYSIDAKNVLETKCTYTPNLMELLMIELENYGIDKMSIKIPTHSGIRYVQENNKYITGIESFQKSYDRPLIGMYVDCVAKMKKTKEALAELIEFHFAKQSINTLDKTTVGNLLTSLSILQNSVYNLDIKVKDESSKRAVQTRINELVTEYTKLA